MVASVVTMFSLQLQTRCMMGSKRPELKTLKQLIVVVSICLHWQCKQRKDSVHF